MKQIKQIMKQIIKQTMKQIIKQRKINKISQ